MPEEVAVTVEEWIYAPEKSIFVAEKCAVALEEEDLTADDTDGADEEGINSRI
jgi:hypothetical protein